MFRSNFQRALAGRLGRPQRHRLLHGYPMRPLMRPAAGRPFPISATRPLLVGVLPHASCNPTLRGCGFCTFGHERYRRSAAVRVTDAVTAHVRKAACEGELRTKPVAGLYFGGGTANLTPPDAFGRLATTLAEAFDLSGAEITLEGAPAYFLSHDAALLDIVAALPARHRRVSMGVQSFDPGWVERMGRTHFGSADAAAGALHAAHARGMTASCDLLINLPGQSTDAMIADVDHARRIGFDQVCIYNLVLDARLGTEWARDPTMLALRKPVDVAAENYVAVRRHLLGRGFVQSSLTNFERAPVARSPRRFTYESDSFRPDVFDAVGFGPGAISTFTADDPSSGKGGVPVVKRLAVAGGEAFAGRVENGLDPTDLEFEYGREDRRLLFLTRSLSVGAICRVTYRSLFGGYHDAQLDHVARTLTKRRLATSDDECLRLTPRGMFFADAIAGALAEARVESLRRAPLAVVDEAAMRSPMG